MMKTTAGLALAALIAGGAAFAQNMPAGQGQAGQTAQTAQAAEATTPVTRDEWTTRMTGGTAFTEWDADQDQMINANDFGGGLFGIFDEDGDGNLTSAEWDDGIDNWYGEQAVELDFAQWDTDGNGSLNRDEFTQQFETAGLFDQFREAAGLDTTADGLDQDDFAGGMFDWMDANDDDNLSPDENRWMQ